MSEQILEEKMRLTVLGARGSMPGEGGNVAVYGGSTSCYRIKVGNEEIYLDAGSGIAGVMPEKNTNVSILLTHMHLDHLVGLPFFSALGEAKRKISIYGGERDGLSVKDAVDRLIVPPFWPICIENYPASVEFHSLNENGAFKLGIASIEYMEGNHPGGSTVFKIACNGKSIVYATDFEHNDKSAVHRLTDFAAGADLFLYDAQYTEKEYERYVGYGHSTPEAGLEIGSAAKVKAILFVHHAPHRSDAELEEMQSKFSDNGIKVSFAKIGDDFLL
ncbi:MAG: MBL fold metallo-hydrolase [Selenomonadaceae bacterium]|nr:MBL fold metallo-hydrolase [Selenomonadaceae bacterium]